MCLPTLPHWHLLSWWAYTTAMHALPDRVDYTYWQQLHQHHRMLGKTATSSSKR